MSWQLWIVNLRLRSFYLRRRLDEVLPERLDVDAGCSHRRTLATSNLWPRMRRAGEVPLNLVAGVAVVRQNLCAEAPSKKDL